MNFRQPITLRPNTREDENKNHNKTLAWSSINSNPCDYQEMISPLNYKVSNPSSSLIMSSLSNIYENYSQDVQSSRSHHNQSVQQNQNNKKKVRYTKNTYMDMGDIDTKQSEEYGNLLKNNKDTRFHKRKESENNDFYQYLVRQEHFEGNMDNNYPGVNNVRKVSNSERVGQAGDRQINQLQRVRQKGMNISNESVSIKPEYTLGNNQLSREHLQGEPQVVNNSISMQESLLHLQHSQEQLSFLKQKLQQAYQKLEKEILHSYQLEEHIEAFRVQMVKNKQEIQMYHMDLEAQRQQREKLQQLLSMEKNQNQKLKFTLKTIIKNQNLNDELSSTYNKQSHTNKNNSMHSEDSNVRQEELKENLKLKLQLKQTQFIIAKMQSTIEQIKAEDNHLQQANKTLLQQNAKLSQQILSKNQELTITKEQLQKLKQQLSSKDKQQNSQQLIESLQAQNKALLSRQIQNLNRINILEQQLRTVTDEKVTIISRLKHQIALLQAQIQQLLNQNHAIKSHQLQYIEHQSYPAYSPSTAKNYNNNHNKSVDRFTVNKTSRNNNTFQQTPLIFDSQDEQQKDKQQQNHSRNNSLTNVALNKNKSNNFINTVQENKQNISINTQYHQHQQYQQQSITSETQLSRIQKSVGKWKRSNSVSNNSSTYFEPSSQQQQNSYQQIQSKHLDANMPQKECPTQKLIQSKLNLMGPQTEDQKLSKYQQHRKNIETELQNLEKIKRPTKEERQKMQKLEKQLYYLDSDIAGLKRKIRRKY